MDVDEPQTTSAQPIGPLQERGKRHVHANVEVKGPNLSPNSECSIGADEVPISEDQPPDFNSNSNFDPTLTQHVEKEASLLPSLSSHNNKYTKSSVSIKYNCNVPTIDGIYYWGLRIFSKNFISF